MAVGPQGASAILAATGCAFVQFRKWAEAEAAIDMHNAKTVLQGAEVPLVVKFADARKKDGFVHGLKRGLLADPWADKRQLGGGIPEAFLQVLCLFKPTAVVQCCCYCWLHGCDLHIVRVA